MSDFFQDLKKDFEKAKDTVKKDFDDYINDVDGETNAKETKAQEEKAYLSAVDQIMALEAVQSLSVEDQAKFKTQIQEILKNFQNESYQNGFGQGYFEGVMAESTNVSQVE